MEPYYEKDIIITTKQKRTNVSYLLFIVSIGFCVLIFIIFAIKYINKLKCNEKPENIIVNTYNGMPYGTNSNTAEVPTSAVVEQ